MRFARERAERTWCPSEVARTLRPEQWRPLMPAIRAEAAKLVESGKLHCWQKGEPAHPTTARGPIRLSG